MDVFPILSTDRWNFAIDEKALKEKRAYREFQARDDKIKQTLAKTAPGTEEYERIKLASTIFDTLREIGWPNPETLDRIQKTRVIRWVDEKQSNLPVGNR
jgi:hypothetical protein